MSASISRNVLVVATRWIAALALLAVAPAWATTLVASPAMGRAGTSVTITATGLTPSTNYALEFAGSGTTAMGTFASNVAGQIKQVITIGALPAVAGKLRLKTTGLGGGTVVAYTTFNSLAPLSISVGSGTVHAGQSLPFQVNGLANGSLTLVYEGGDAFGPVPVAAGTYRGRLVIPSDRPASLPASAQISVINRVGRVEVSRLDTTLAVEAPLAAPFQFAINTPQTPQAKSSQPVSMLGTVQVGDNESAPEQISLWYFGDNGDVFPLGSARPQANGGGFDYELVGRSPGVWSMTAGQQSAGQIGVVGAETNTHGMVSTVEQRAANPRLDQLADDIWRIRVRVVEQDGTPIPGAVVQFDGADVAEPDAPLQFGRVGSMAEYLADNIAPSQLQVFRSSDDRGCPLTLNRKLTDSQGYAEFQFTDDELAIATLAVPAGQDNLNQPILQPRPLRLAVDASGQGFGFQFSSGPDVGHFLPHVYRVQMDGVGDGDPTDDEIIFYDDYQNVELARGSRDFSYTQPLPEIVPMVVLYDTSILPLVSHRVRTLVTNSGGSNNYLLFGPIYSQRNVSAPWIVNVPGQGYPTAVSVRTDPVVSGVVTSSTLFLDANQDGNPEFITNFQSAITALDCSIDGLAQSKTWSASLPSLNLKQEGQIKGYVEFNAASGSVRQDIAIKVNEVDTAWMGGTRISGQQVVYGSGGQRVSIHAIENNGDESVQLDHDPGHQIGRLNNRTANTRLIDMVLDRHGVADVQSPLDGTHKEAGRTGAPTLIEPETPSDSSLDASFHEHETLLDQSFPLFYYVWGVPLLAGIELGANFTVLAEIFMDGKAFLKSNGQPALELTTTPTLDLGLNFYIDIDVLFDLVDGGVDLDAIFALDLPITVIPDRTPDEITVDECFTASLILSWHFEVFCLPFDFICDSFNDIEGSEPLLSDQTGTGCANPIAPLWQMPTIAGTRKATRASARIKPLQTAFSYSPTGAGFMALTRDLSAGAQPPVLAVRPVDGGDFSRSADETVLSTSPGIRSVDVAFYRDDRAVIVWAESADDYATLAARTPLQRIARQHLMYSLWNGSAWSPKQMLTPVSGGEGGVDLSACRADTDPGCPVDGEVLAVWTRDTTGNMLDHQTQVFFARFTDAAGWTVPASVDAAAVLDSAPAAGYAAGKPVVALVRSQSGVFSDTNARRIGYRLLGVPGSTVQVPAASPIAAAWPSIAGHPDGRFEIVHTHADDPAMFVGNTQRVALLSFDSCNVGVCAASARVLTDSIGRAVYGERPEAITDDLDNVQVVMRGLGFGNAANGSDHRIGDPIGMVAHTGDVITFAVGDSAGIITPRALSADGAGHFAPAATFDPMLKRVVAGSTRGLELPAQLRKRYEAGGKKISSGVAKGILADPDLEVFAMEQGSDFAIEAISTSVSSLTGGGPIATDVTLRNVGAAYVSTTDTRYMVLLSWDAPYDAGGVHIAGRFVPTLASGQKTILHNAFTIPAEFSPDQFHRLYARVVRTGIDVVDTNGDNDLAEVDFGGMPRVFGVHASAVPDSTLVQLVWDAPTDPESLIAGYRVWYHDGDGDWKHLGSSFETGFIDLAAPPNVVRHYRVTSYSRNAVESESSSEMVAKATLSLALFRSGFE